jgi:F0F1-type ATP synthase assembly protein I
MRPLGMLTTIPVFLAVTPLVGFFIGQFLDRRFHTDPIFTVLFLILGFVGGGRQVAQLIRRAYADQEDRDESHGG